jgi:transposase
MHIIKLTQMSQPTPPHPRKEALRAAGALHPHPEAVQDESFRAGEFFDPDDLVQVKYEMLRRHRVENKPVTDVARSFGASRQTFYAAAALFDSQGIPALIPKRRGPRHPHKCTDEVLDFAANWKDEHPADPMQRVAEAIQERFGLSINPRSIDRALARRKKKRTPPAEAPP